MFRAMNNIIFLFYFFPVSIAKKRRTNHVFLIKILIFFISIKRLIFSELVINLSLSWEPIFLSLSL